MTIEFKNGVPTFFGQGPTICLRDPLAAFLGAAEGGLMTYSYQDAVKLAGHSCPTVAGSFVAVIRGLKALYSNDMPERGNIEVLMTKGKKKAQQVWLPLSQHYLRAQQRKWVLLAWV